MRELFLGLLVSFAFGAMVFVGIMALKGAGDCVSADGSSSQSVLTNCKE